MYMFTILRALHVSPGSTVSVFLKTLKTWVKSKTLNGSFGYF